MIQIYFISKTKSTPPAPYQQWQIKSQE